jgi:hypothetical protein
MVAGDHEERTKEGQGQENGGPPDKPKRQIKHGIVALGID